MGTCGLFARVRMVRARNSCDDWAGDVFGQPYKVDRLLVGTWCALALAGVAFWLVAAYAVWRLFV